jgi:hypothetical protein
MSENKTIGQNLAKKILAVQKGAANIPKNGYNDFHRYKYVLAADAVEHIRELCVANDLVVTTLGVNGVSKFAEQLGKNKDQTVTEVHITYLIADPTSGESLTFDWVGHGADPLDKGVFKAFTGAQKYGIMQFFMVAGDDADPETVTNRERKVAQKPQEQAKSDRQAPTGAKPAQESPKVTGVGQTAKVTLEDAKKMTPADQMAFLLKAPKERLVNLATTELARVFQNNATVGDHFLLAMLEKDVVTSDVIEQNAPKQIAQLICETWAMEKKQGVKNAG